MRIIITNEGVKEISSLSKNSSTNSIITTKFYNPLNYMVNNILVDAFVDYNDFSY